MMASGQSPVDIPSTAPRHGDGITWSYRTAHISVGHNSAAVQFDCASGSAIGLAGTRYELRQFHIHAPSEHTFDLQHRAMELHLVHQSSDGRLAVVAVTVESGAYLPAVAGAFALLAAERTVSASFHLDALLPNERTFVAYEGSLTTPPFTEGVAWRVLTRPIELSAAQIDGFRALHERNNRPLQPMGGRSFEG